MRDRFVRRGAGASALALVLTLSAVGCSDGGRDFAVPEKLCGTPVDQDALDPFLPPEGEKLTEKDRALVTSDTGCTVRVDGHDAVTFGQAALDKRIDPVNSLKEDLLKHVAPLRDLPVKGKGAYADTGAVLLAECGAKGTEHLLLEFRFGTDDARYPEDVKERRKAIQRLVADVAPPAVKKRGCTASAA